MFKCFLAKSACRSLVLFRGLDIRCVDFPDFALPLFQALPRLEKHICVATDVLELAKMKGDSRFAWLIVLLHMAFLDRSGT